MVLLEALVVASFIDFDLKIIPDGCTLPAMAVGLAGGFLVGQVYLVPAWFQSPELKQFATILPAWMHPLLEGPAIPPWFAEHPHWHGLLVSVLGLLVGGGIVWAVRIIGHLVLRQEAMGFGDVILMAAIGSFLGWQPTVMVFFLAPLCALAVFVLSVFFHRHREIPYGPYLSLATLLVILLWRPIWSFAERIFAMGPFVLFAGAAMAAVLVVLLTITQGVKWLLGIPLYPAESLWSDEWTSADQLAHFAGETWDEHQGLWRPQEKQRWPGQESGRGTLYDARWRRGS
jgi:leader peptidase (prepilin peptidase)/N-methyltransferase